MREFFRPFRRKLGVLVLVVACVLLTCWIRGNVVADLVRIATGNDGSFNLLLRRGGVALSFEQFPKASGPKTSSYVAITPENAEQWYLLEGRNPKVYVQACGVKWTKYVELVASSPVGEPFLIQTTVLTIPYWLLVLPPTLLAAYLLLSKPRPKPSQPDNSRNLQTAR